MRNQRAIVLITIFVIIAFGALACNKNSNSSENKSANAADNRSSNSTATNNRSSMPKQGGNSTPTAAFETFYNALKDKDAQALKSVMPKEMVERGEESAKAQNKTLDELIRDGFNQGALPKPPDKMPETSNEKIADDGKTATLDVKDPDSGKIETLHLVKEDDGWKIKDFS